MKESKCCPHCQAKMVEYRHSLNKKMVTALILIQELGGRVDFSKLARMLKFNDSANFQKLRYWGLTRKCKSDDGERIGGVWELTEKGQSFLNGAEGVHEGVWTYRGEAVRFYGKILMFKDLATEGYRTKEDYTLDERPRSEAT